MVYHSFAGIYGIYSVSLPQIKSTRTTLMQLRTFTCVGIVPVANEVVKDLEGHKDKDAAVIFVTIWELGEAAGPLFIAPLSELFGRWPLYNFCNLFLIVGIVMTALSQEIGMLIFSRFLSGCAVATNVLNPAVVADIWPSKSRGKAMSAVMLAPLLGGAIGPAVAGALARETGWREIMWLALGLAGTCEVTFLMFFRETFKVAILQRRAARLRKETGDHSIRTEFDEEGKSKLQTVFSSMARPLVVISGSFVLQIFSLWGALIFSFFYIMSTTLPDILADVYGFDEAERGVAFMSFSKSFIPILANHHVSNSCQSRWKHMRPGSLQLPRRPPLRQTSSQTRRESFPRRPAAHNSSLSLRIPVRRRSLRICSATTSSSLDITRIRRGHGRWDRVLHCSHAYVRY